MSHGVGYRGIWGDIRSRNGLREFATKRRHPVSNYPSLSLTLHPCSVCAQHISRVDPHERPQRFTVPLPVLPPWPMGLLTVLTALMSGRACVSLPASPR